MEDYLLEQLENWNICLRQKLSILRQYQEQLQKDRAITTPKKIQIFYNLDITKQLIKNELNQYRQLYKDTKKRNFRVDRDMIHNLEESFKLILEKYMKMVQDNQDISRSLLEIDKEEINDYYEKQQIQQIHEDQTKRLKKISLNYQNNHYLNQSDGLKKQSTMSNSNNTMNLSTKNKLQKEESFTMDTFNSRYKKLLVYKQLNEKKRPSNKYENKKLIQQLNKSWEKMGDDIKMTDSIKVPKKQESKKPKKKRLSRQMRNNDEQIQMLKQQLEKIQLRENVVKKVIEENSEMKSQYRQLMQENIFLQDKLNSQNQQLQQQQLQISQLQMMTQQLSMNETPQRYYIPKNQ